MRADRILAAWLVLAAIALSGCGGGSQGGGGGAAPTGTQGGSTPAASAQATSGAEPRLKHESGLSADAQGELALRPLALSPRVRNEPYRVFATNGSRLTLKLDMVAKTYEMTDAAGDVAAGTFAEDSAEPGSYVFASPRITA